MLTKEEYDEIIEEIIDDFMLHSSRYISIHSPRFMVNISAIKNLIEAYFELVKENERLTSQLLVSQKVAKANQEKIDELLCNRQPYKFEDLKHRMWVCDDKSKNKNIVMVFNTFMDKGKKLIRISYDGKYFTIEFEGNRFYPVWVAK